jgi:outer membrane protein OmpA-like peptidoglycan-associated protein
LKPTRYSAAALLALALASIPPLAASATMPTQDTVKGAKDSPLVSRFEGAKIVGYEVKAFDDVSLVAGKRGKGAFEKNVALEGKYTRIAYNFPKERSAVEVMRSYQAALEKAGLKVAYACAKETCGPDFGEWFRDKQLNNNFIQGSSDFSSPFNYGRNDARYLLATGTTPGGAVVNVAVLTVAPVQDQNGGVYVQIVEAKPMDAGKVSASLNAADMAKGIAADGKVAVYGLYFDTDKSAIKPESKAALAEMAELMQRNPQLKVYIVGHTDNQGALAHNLALSQQRADAVVKALSTDYKVDGKRLSAKGVASYAPLASNDGDAGREKNRRVELVKQ